MYKNFENYIYGLIGMNGGTMTSLIYNMSNKLYELTNSPNQTEVSQILPNKLVPGRFYLIQYNFNGNPIWCPIFALDYKVIKNNHLLYAINLEYLPPRYKIMFFNNLFKGFSDTLDNISQSKYVVNEQPLNFLNFEVMYNLLKKNNMHYSVTAYTIKDFNEEYKIQSSYLCSVKILPEIIMSDFKRINQKNMIAFQKTLIGSPTEYTLKKIIEDYSKILDEYQEDSLEYHKRVALFRDKLKLFK